MRKLINIVENAKTNEAFSFGSYNEVEFVCINPETGGTDPQKMKALYDDLRKMSDLIVYRQDYLEEGGHIAVAAVIYPSSSAVKPIDLKRLAKSHGVKVDEVRKVSDSVIDDLFTGQYENLIDAAMNQHGSPPHFVKGREWSEGHQNWTGFPYDGSAAEPRE